MDRPDAAAQCDPEQTHDHDERKDDSRQPRGQGEGDDVNVNKTMTDFDRLTLLSEPRRPAVDFALSADDVVDGAPEEDAYRMDYPKRGLFYLINNKTFHRSTNMSIRTGTDVDAEGLCRLFGSLGFKVMEAKDRTIAQMEGIIQLVSKLDHSKSDMFALAILSHGDQGVVYGVDGKIGLDHLLAPWKGDGCTSLIGKPKLIIIQACRGNKVDKGTEQTDSGGEPSYRIPIEADFLYAYSTCPGYYAWRNQAAGSWYVQALCEVIRDYCQTREITWILTRTNRQVAYYKESHAARKDMDKCKQMPSFVSQLTKELYIVPKK